MSEFKGDFDPPEPVRLAAPRREVADWEYRTAYFEHLQVRIPANAHARLCEWAGEEQKPLEVLLIETLEEAVRRRNG